MLAIRKGGVFPGRQFSLDEEVEDEDGDDNVLLEKKVKAAAMPEAALRVCLKELRRYVLVISDKTTFHSCLRTIQQGTFAVVFRPIKMKSISLQFNHYFNE